MAAIVKEERRMDNPNKTYLQMYEEFISGYKQYKLERAAMDTRRANAGFVKK